MKTRMLLLACAFMALSVQTAIAAEDEESRSNRHEHRNVSWSYIEASSLGYDLDVAGVDIEPDGYKLKLSLELGDSLYGVIDRGRAEGSFAGSDYDFDTEGYGFGFHGDSWFASYTYNTWDFDNNEFDVDTLRVGFRNMLSERLEFNASYSWNAIEDADNEDGFQLGFAYQLFWDDVSFTTEYETIGGHLDVDYLTFGLRFDF